MSSTSRGAQREKSDYYVTPQWAILDFIREFSFDVASQPDVGGLIDTFSWRGFTGLEILDPCAGGCEKHGMAYPEAIAKGGWGFKDIMTMDIRPDSHAAVVGDYLKTKVARNYDIIITNPPFSCSLEITQKALKDVREGGLVIMLQRLNWFGSQDRKAFWQSSQPVACYVHSKRMKFSEAASTDSIEYAHFVFQRGNHPKFTQTRVI